MGKFTKDKRVRREIQYSKNDVYYRKAKEDNYRARSAYKLIQIDELYDIFAHAERIIDLCAAPGSWSQVCQARLKAKGLLEKNSGTRIIAVDLQEMAPIDKVVQLVGDITKRKTVESILSTFQNNLADLVICDGAPDVTGFHDMDQYVQSQLLVAALNICLKTLRPGGKFIAKVFKGSDTEFLYSQFKYYFNEVYFVKPNSSRESSVEYFIVCLNYIPSEKDLDLSTFFCEVGSKETLDEKVFKFITCGDLSGFDDEQNEEGTELTAQKKTNDS